VNNIVQTNQHDEMSHMPLRGFPHFLKSHFGLAKNSNRQNLRESKKAMCYNICVEFFCFVGTHVIWKTRS